MKLSFQLLFDGFLPDTAVNQGSEVVLGDVFGVEAVVAIVL